MNESEIWNKDRYPVLANESDVLIGALKILDGTEVDARILDGLFPLNPKLSSKEYRLRVLNLFGNKCFVCGYKLFKDVHHVIHKSRGGTDRIDNLVVLCPNHHKEWHLIEKTFFTGYADPRSGLDRADAASRTDWQIPDFILTNKIAPFLVQLAKIAAEN